MISVGQTIGNYTITAKLGEGGMGVVYLAEHPVIGRKVAMKAIHPELSRNPEVVSRFITEAKAVNQIGNEHIVDIHDFGTTTDGEFYFIMEFLQGESLADRLKRERLFPAPRALQIAAQVADALAASHTHHIVHRDLKPENIFLINRGASIDFVKVLDFGLAKLTQGEEKVTHKTRTGSVMGTPYYMAPEQCEGKANIDQRADLYSLGVILYEMMTGKVPFTGEGYGEIIVKHITQPPPAPRSVNPRLTAAHEAILLRALAKRREDRFQSMEEFRAAMLDPEGYLAAAPAAVTPRPVVPTAATVYATAGDSPEAAVGVDVDHPGPLPSTFRDGIGEVLDEDIAPRKSRKGLVIGILLAAAGAGAGAVLLTTTQGETDRPPALAPTTAPAPTTGPAPAAPAGPTEPAPPQKVVIKFESKPAGAQVTRKDTGQVLGTTPFEQEFAYGKTAVDFVFKKASFEELPLSFVPELSGVLAATLVPVRALADDDDKGARAPGRPAARSRAAPPPPKTRKPSSPRPLSDEDGVLEPSFR